MKKKRKARGTHNEFPLDDDMSLTGIVSMTDSTGIVPAGNIENPEEDAKTSSPRKRGKK